MQTVTGPGLRADTVPEGAAYRRRLRINVGTGSDPPYNGFAATGRSAAATTDAHTATATTFGDWRDGDDATVGRSRDTVRLETFDAAAHTQTVTVATGVGRRGVVSGNWLTGTDAGELEHQGRRSFSDGEWTIGGGRERGAVVSTIDQAHDGDEQVIRSYNGPLHLHGFGAEAGDYG